METHNCHSYVLKFLFKSPLILIIGISKKNECWNDMCSGRIKKEWYVPCLLQFYYLKIYKNGFLENSSKCNFEKKWFGIICKFWKQNLLVWHRLAALITWRSLKKSYSIEINKKFLNKFWRKNVYVLDYDIWKKRNIYTYINMYT